MRILKLLRFLKLVYGLIFISSAVLIIINNVFAIWYHYILIKLFQNDLGYSIVLISIGIISLAYIKDSDIVKPASSLFISTALAGVMFFIRILVVLSHYIDTYILYLRGESYIFSLANELGFLEIYLAPLTFTLLYYTYNILRRKTI